MLRILFDVIIFDIFLIYFSVKHIIYYLWLVNIYPDLAHVCEIYTTKAMTKRKSVIIITS